MILDPAKIKCIVFDFGFTLSSDYYFNVIPPGFPQWFDVVLNSSDYHEIRKEFLWPIAFERLGGGIGYANSLLIEDGETETAMFRALGGQACRYFNDELFLEWLEAVHWNA